MGNIKIGVLNKIDITIRGVVKRWLAVPSDCPSAFIHAGGLGISSLRTLAPLLIVNRLSILNLPNFENEPSATAFLAKEIDKAKLMLKLNGHIQLTNKMDIGDYWKSKLVSMVDGNGLQNASSTLSTHRWIREPTKLLSGRDFINCLRTRINALPSRSRTARGRPLKDRLCRGGCHSIETTNHINTTMSKNSR